MAEVYDSVINVQRKRSGYCKTSRRTERILWEFLVTMHLYSTTTMYWNTTHRALPALYTCSYMPCHVPEMCADYLVPFSRCVLYRSGNSRHTAAKPGKPRLRHYELPIHHILSSSHRPISLQAPRHDASAVPCCPYEGPSDSALPKEGTCEEFDGD